MTTVITGGAGFIGSNLVHALNASGQDDLLVVDDPNDFDLAPNLAGARYLDHLPKEVFRGHLTRRSPLLDDVALVIHLGANTRTDEPDVDALMDTNLTASLEILDWCEATGTRLIYASSASVYGRSAVMCEDPANEDPRNAYARSKLLVDQEVRRRLPVAAHQIVGLRFFNVYGKREAHKGPMASMVTQLDAALAAGRPLSLFGASHGRPAGGHARDFVHVEDVVAVIRWFAEHPDASGIFNCGTGQAATFQALAEAVAACHGGGRIGYRPMPDGLAAGYQPWTQADLTRLRAVGCDVEFRSLEAGVAELLGGEVSPGPQAAAWSS